LAPIELRGSGVGRQNQLYAPIVELVHERDEPAEQFGTFIKREVEKYETLAKKIGVKVE
jgi:hypothetical protein